MVGHYDHGKIALYYHNIYHDYFHDITIYDCDFYIFFYIGLLYVYYICTTMINDHNLLQLHTVPNHDLPTLCLRYLPMEEAIGYIAEVGAMSQI